MFMCAAHNSSPSEVGGWENVCRYHLVSLYLLKVQKYYSQGVKQHRDEISALHEIWKRWAQKLFGWKIQNTRPVVIKNTLESRRAFVPQNKRLQGIKSKKIKSSCDWKLLYCKWKTGKREKSVKILKLFMSSSCVFFYPDLCRALLELCNLDFDDKRNVCIFFSVVEDNFNLFFFFFFWQKPIKSHHFYQFDRKTEGDNHKMI